MRVLEWHSMLPLFPTPHWRIPQAEIRLVTGKRCFWRAEEISRAHYNGAGDPQRLRDVGINHGSEDGGGSAIL